MAMSSLIPGALFQNTGLNQSYTPTEITASPEQIRTKYRRASINGEEWPPNSPVAQVYDARNSSSRLIILNNKMSNKQSHLRVQSARQRKSDSCKVEPQRHFQSDSPPRPDRHSDCFDSSSPHYVAPGLTNPQSTVRPSTANQSAPRSSTTNQSAPRSSTAKQSDVRPTTGRARVTGYASFENNPQTAEWHHYSAQPPSRNYLRRSANTKIKKSSIRNEIPAPPHSFRKDKKWLQHPDMTMGQKRYMHEIATVYDMTHMKQLKQAQYSQLIDREVSRGFLTPENFRRYLNYLASERIWPYGVQHAPSVLTRTRPKTARSSDKQRMSDQQSALRPNSQITNRNEINEKQEDSNSVASETQHEKKTVVQDKQKIKRKTNDEKSVAADDKLVDRQQKKEKNVRIKKQSLSNSSSSEKSELQESSRASRPSTSMGHRQRSAGEKNSLGHRNESDSNDSKDKNDSPIWWNQPAAPEREQEPNGDGLVMTRDKELQQNDEHLVEMHGETNTNQKERLPTERSLSRESRHSSSGSRISTQQKVSKQNKDGSASTIKSKGETRETQTLSPDSKEELRLLQKEAREALESDHDSELVETSST